MKLKSKKCRFAIKFLYLVLAIFLYPGIFLNAKQNKKKYDFVIKNGFVYDGTLKNPEKTDIAVRDDKIVFIGKVTKNDLMLTKKIIDAKNMIVTPGFIDIHNHNDNTFLKAGKRKWLLTILPGAKGNYNFIYQGVTTVVDGNCGSGFTDTDQYFNLLKKIKYGTNVCHLIPHGSLREELFGTGKQQTERLSDNQLVKLKKRIEEEMQKGAFGLSTGLEYYPGLITPTDEIVELTKVVAKYNGIYATHMRDYKGCIMNNGLPGIINGLNEAILIAKKSGVSLQISHLILRKPAGKVTANEIIKIFRNARADGINIHADQIPYTSATTILSFRLADDFRIRYGVKEQYKTEEGKKIIAKYIKKEFANFPPEKMLIVLNHDNPRLEGLTIKEIAKQSNKLPEEVYADLVTQRRVPWATFYPMDEKFFKEIMQADFIMTSSDGQMIPKNIAHPHPNFYGTFTRKLEKFGLNSKQQNFTAIIRTMTSLPAEKLGIKKRGKIKTGYYADLAIIDLNKLKENTTIARPHQYSTGIIHLFINGIQAIKNEKATGKKRGRVIRKNKQD